MKSAHTVVLGIGFTTWKADIDRSCIVAFACPNLRLDFAISSASLSPESISVSNQDIHRALGAYPPVPDWIASNLSGLKHARHKAPGL